MPSKRIAYEIVPGSIFPRPGGLVRATFQAKAKAQRLAHRLFERELRHRLGLSGKGLGTRVVRGGWAGAVNPSTQVLLHPRVRQVTLRAYAAALGLIWRQDAVAAFFLRPGGPCLVARISRVDGRRISGARMQAFYDLLYRHDAR